MNNDKFLQPIDAIEVVSRAEGSRTLLNKETLELGRARVAAGESLESVALDLAFQEVAMEEAWAGEEIEPTVLTSRTSQRAMHTVADAHQSKLSVAVRYAFAQGRAAINKTQLRSRSFNAAVAGAPEAVRLALLDVLPTTLLQVMKAGGEAGVTLLEKQLKAAELRTAAAGPFKIRFDASDPNAIEWAQKHAAELATGISETTRERIATAVENALVTGEDAYDEILAAVGDEARAEVITRTEVMTAANEGQRQSWDQAVDKGLLDVNSNRVWIATVGCCDECDALDEQTTTLDGEYPEPGADGPPLHPNCRCTEGIVG